MELHRIMLDILALRETTPASCLLGTLRFENVENYNMKVWLTRFNNIFITKADVSRWRVIYTNYKPLL